MHLTCTLKAWALTGAACCALKGDSLAAMRLPELPKHAEADSRLLPDREERRAACGGAGPCWY